MTIKVGDKITTDHIMPAGARLKYRSNIPVYSKFVFEPVDEHFSERCTENQDRGGKDNFIVAGASYGQGSSREHAAICPMYLGVKAVIAVSIERIHQNNLCNFGIVPLTFEKEEDYTRFDQNDELVIENIAEQIKSDKVVLKNKTKSREITLRCDITDGQRAMLVGGGLLNILKEKA